MTIAKSIIAQRNTEQWTSLTYMSACKKLAVKRHMDGPDFRVFTFEEDSTIEMYWS